jgi:phosphoglycolate phosphatase-like HAD superfamily hydrolase
MIGDRYSDIVAGKIAGCFTIFLQCGYNEQQLCVPDLTVECLSAIFPPATER